MKTAKTMTFAERAGRFLGRIYCAIARRDEMAIDWLAAMGFSAKAATILWWSIKLFLLALLFYSLFWVGLIIVSIWVAGKLSWVAGKLSWIDGLSRQDREPEWRMGTAGFGLYTYEGHRIDPHVEDDD